MALLGIACGGSPDGFPRRIACVDDGYAVGVAPSVPSGLAWDGYGLWMTSANEDLVRRLDPLTAQVDRECQSPVSGPGPLLFHDDVLWVASASAEPIWRLDPLTCVAEPAEAPEDATFPPTAPLEVSDGQDLWRADPEARAIRRICGEVGGGTTI